MKKAPKVLTRMRLSCCWGDNLNVKELNDVVDYINELEQQCKKQKEVIEEVRDRITIKLGRYINEKDYVIDDVALDELLQILDKVKNNVYLKDILKEVKEDN